MNEFVFFSRKPQMYHFSECIILVSEILESQDACPLYHFSEWDRVLEFACEPWPWWNLFQHLADAFAVLLGARLGILFFFWSYRCSIICDVPFRVMCAWCIFVFSIAWPWYCVPRSSIWVSLRVIPWKIACIRIVLSELPVPGMMSCYTSARFM